MPEENIRPLERYSRASDALIVTRGTAVVTGMTGNPNFPNPPIDLALLKAAIERLKELMAEALDRSRKVIAEKNKKREEVIDMLRLLGRYVEVSCKGKMEIFLTSGLEPVLTKRGPHSAISKNIRSIIRGKSGELVIQLVAAEDAASYDVRYRASRNGVPPTKWTTKTVTRVRPALKLVGLVPATVYEFQVRTLTDSGYSDWSDSVSFMCT
jgi:fibronectin type III domain protein